MMNVKMESFAVSRIVFRQVVSKLTTPF